MSNAMNLADQLGTIQAAIADLKKQEAALKGAILESGTLEGDLFKATVVEAERSTVNWKAVAQKLEPSHQLVRAHTSRKDVVSIRVTAKPTTTKAVA